MTRDDLKPGMIVKNTVSNRYALVRGCADNPKALVPAHADYVAVRRRGPKRKCEYPFWALEHVEIPRNTGGTFGKSI